MFDRVAGFSYKNLIVFQKNLSTDFGIGAKNGSHRLGPARTDQSGDSKKLAFADGKGHRVGVCFAF